MTIELALAGVGLVVALAAFVVSVYAICDVRKQVRDLILLQRKRVFTQVRNDMVWLFIDPTERAHTAEIAKGLEEFAVLSMALDKKHTPDLTNHAVNNEALMFANKLVKGGYANWKPGWNMEEVQKTLRDWQTAINDNRMANILGKDLTEKSLL